MMMTFSEVYSIDITEWRKINLKSLRSRTKHTTVPQTDSSYARFRCDYIMFSLSNMLRSMELQLYAEMLCVTFTITGFLDSCFNILLSNAFIISIRDDYYFDSNDIYWSIFD